MKTIAIRFSSRPVFRCFSRLVVLLSAAIALSVVLLPPSVVLSQALSEQIEIEQKIQERLAQKIEGVVPKDRFKLIINAKVARVTERIPIEGETASQVDGTKTKAQEAVAAMPGFEALSKPEERNPEVMKQNTKSKFRFSTYTKISHVDINLILDEGLEEPRKQFIETIVKQDIDTTLGGVAKLNIASFSLTGGERTLFQKIQAWFSEYLSQRGGSGLDLAALAILVLLFLLAIISLAVRAYKFFTKPADSATSSAGSARRGGSEENASEGNEDPIISQLIDRLVEQVSKSALEVSSFLRQLNPESKRAILEATKTPAMKVHFRQLMGVAGETDKKYDGDKKALIDQLTAVEKDLERFLTIQMIQVKKHFGYLSLLHEDQIVQFVNESENKVDDLAVLTKYLSKPQFDAISSHLSLDEKAELFKLMRSQAAVSSDRLQELDSSLRRRYQRLKEQSSLVSKNAEEVERELLENSENVNELIETLKLHNVPLTPAYDKYLVTFDKLLTMDNGIMREVMGRVSNETLAKALAKQPITSLIRESLGDIRSKLVESTKGRYTRSDQREISGAQKDILKIYWKLT